MINIFIRGYKTFMNFKELIIKLLHVQQINVTIFSLYTHILHVEYLELNLYFNFYMVLKVLWYKI